MSKPNIHIRLLGLFFLVQTATIAQHTPLKQGTKKSTVVKNEMTVIKIFPTNQGDTATRVIFQTSQRIYLLPVHSKKVYLNRLKESLNKKVAVLVRRKNEQSDVILSVEPVKKQ